MHKTMYEKMLWRLGNDLLGKVRHEKDVLGIIRHEDIFDELCHACPTRSGVHEAVGHVVGVDYHGVRVLIIHEPVRHTYHKQADHRSVECFGTFAM